MHQVRIWHMSEEVGDHLAVLRPLAMITVVPKPISAAREQGVAWF